MFTSSEALFGSHRSTTLALENKIASFDFGERPTTYFLQSLAVFVPFASGKGKETAATQVIL